MRIFISWTTFLLAASSFLLAGNDASRSGRLGKPLAEVPFTLDRNAVIVQATLDGRHELRLLLDTGWGPLALVSTSAKRLNLHAKGPAGELPRVDVDSLAIGRAIKRNISFEVFPAEELEPLIGPYDGVLGTAFFRDLVLQIDYPNGIVRFYASSPVSKEPPATPGGRVSVPMVTSPAAGALPFTDSVLVDGKPVRALFDTGGSGGFVAMPQLVERAKLEILTDTSSKTAIGMLSDGQMTQQQVSFTRVGRIALGSFVVESPRVMIAPSKLEGSAWGHDLIIGYGFLRNYVVTFDYPGKVITLERGGPP